MIVMRKEHFEDILAHTAAALPNEGCGLIAGTIADGVKTVEKVYLLTNIDQSPIHFSMDPKEQFAAIKDMRASGWVLLGNFHSHPATPSRPSAEDISLAYDPSASYLIISLADKEQPVLKSFNIKEGSASEEQLEIH
ncbi:MAG: Mov34/MPN/PAD family protein [Paenibacillaceae bacterium]|nr:Mov34/MPN/PAD family protein [Paenibacillaceae bacterium]